MATRPTRPTGTEGSPTETPGRHDAATGRRRHRVSRLLRNGITVFVLVLVLEYVVVPDLLGARKDLALLGRMNVAWLVGGVALEAGALAAYAKLTRAVLPPNGPGFSRLLRIDLSTLAVSHVLPMGTAFGTGLGYRLLTASGVDGADAGFAVATQGIGSAVVLNVLLWTALVVSIPVTGLGPGYLSVAIVGALLLLAFAALVLLFTKGDEHAERVLVAIARPLPFVSERAVTELVARLGTRLRSLGSDRRLLVRAVTWAAANWLLDAASLWAFVAAFGHLVSPVELFVAYGVANVLAAIPLTPGGLGVVETAATLQLVGFGVPKNIALLGVLGWRLVNFWLPIPVGAGAYLSLRVRRGAGLRERIEAVREMTAPREPAPPPVPHDR
jgi:uncharacterized protein (TIRG00374 family)